MSGTVRPEDPARGSTTAPADPQHRAISEQATATASQLRDEAAGAVADIKDEGAQVAEAAKQRAIGFAEEQKRVGADHTESLARAVHGAADDLQETSPQIAHYLKEAAAAVDGFARTLRDSSPGELMGRMEDLARRQPVAYFGAAVLAGFALARFAKSSSIEARRSELDDGRTVSPHRAMGGGTAMPHTTATGAPGWVPASGSADGTTQTARPATVAAASLGGAAARPAAAGRGDVKGGTS
jgi:hypothetical protein